MLVWRIIVELFTNFGDYGLPHIPLFILLFAVLTFLQTFSMKRGKGVVKFLPSIVTISLVMLLQVLVWAVANIMHSYSALLIVVALTYLVVASLGALFGILVYVSMLNFKNIRKS